MITLPGCEASASAIFAIRASTFASGTADPTGNMLYAASSVSPMSAPSVVALTLSTGAVPVMMGSVDFATALPIAAAAAALADDTDATSAWPGSGTAVVGEDAAVAAGPAAAVTGGAAAAAPATAFSACVG